MKLIALFFLLSVYAALSDGPDAGTQKPDKPLYLHFFTHTYYFPSETTPPKRIVSIRVHLSNDIYVAVGADHETLAGRIEQRGDKFFARVSGHYGSSKGSFDGEIQLEKPFQPGSYIFSGGVFSTSFVLSSSPDCEPFLKQQALKQK